MAPAPATHSMPEPHALRLPRTHGAGRKRSNRLAQHSDLYAEAVTTDERDRRIPRLHADHATWLAHRRTKLTLTQTTLSRDVPMRAKSHCTIEKPQHSSSHRSHWMRPRSPECSRRKHQTTERRSPRAPYKTQLDEVTMTRSTRVFRSTTHTRLSWHNRGVHARRAGVQLARASSFGA